MNLKALFEISYGLYLVSARENGILITGDSLAGTFYGIQTLRQIVESPISEGGILPALHIEDYPELHYRGVVEGFYGEPWSHETRLSLIDLYGRYKMNYYIYGPKDDPYHSSPYWREAYPEAEAEEIKELVEACKRNRVHFVWAVHPGKDIKWEESDIQNLIRKFDAMYQLGVRAFAVHFDDISGAGTNPYYQTELMNILNDDFGSGSHADVVTVLNRLTEEFIKPMGCDPITYCPQGYNKAWSQWDSTRTELDTLKGLDDDIILYWTGDDVNTPITQSTVDYVAGKTGQPICFWLNYPVNEHAKSGMFLGDITYYARDGVTGLKAAVSNPSRFGQSNRLIEAFATGVLGILKRGHRFTRLHKMLHMIYVINIQRSKHQYSHSESFLFS